MRIGLSASRLRSNPKQVRLHYRISPSQQFHAHSIAGLQYFATRRVHESAIGLRRIEEIKNVGLVEARELAQGSDGCGHVRAFESAQKTGGDADGTGYVGKGQLA